MPGYGTATGADGLLPWSWAEQRLIESTEIWLATITPEGRPHVMPVWAVWLDGAIWLSTGGRSRKARNLQADPSCTVTTEDPRRPVVIDGVAERITDRAVAQGVTDAMNDKYSSALPDGEGFTVDFVLANHLYRIRPERAFGLEEDRFTDSPTRWVFET
jgi:PPOX class probable F420-dependent enzyme